MPTWAGWSRRELTLGLAAVLFVGVFLLRLVVDDPVVAVAFLYAIPIALVAVELGLAGGVAAAALALVLFGVWEIWFRSADVPGVDVATDFLTRGVVFLVVGGAVGALADRLRRSAGEHARFWELSNELLATAGFDGYFKRLNPAWEQALGWTIEELRSQPFIEFVHPDDRERTAAEAERLSDAEVTVNFENRYRCRDGSYRTLLWSARGEPADGLIYAFARDSTERVRAGEQLAEAKDEADRANRAKSEFLSRMSHELRTPLNAIIGFGQLLELESLDSRQQDQVAQILRGGRHLLELINEVLDISRIEAGTMSISLEPVHVGSVLADVLSLVRPLADEAGLRLDADPSRVGDRYVLADQQRLKQVLINLFSNAIKYNHDGGSVAVRAEPVGDQRLRLTIADDGKGMDETQLGALFTPFERLGAERTEIEGTGLGLALSRRLVEIMGGTIEAESQLGRGTTMRVELAVTDGPDRDAGAAKPTRPLAAAGAADRASKRCTVLYIEDNASNLRLVEQALELLGGVRLISAMHGSLGLELAHEHRPDLVLLDLHLPDLEGVEILERLKGDPATAEIPVTVVSADATKSQMERLRAAGAAGYLTKPIDVSELLDLVSAASRRLAAEAPSEPV